MAGIEARPDEENLRYFHVVIDGPGDSPYQGERGTSNIIYPLYSQIL